MPCPPHTRSHPGAVPGINQRLSCGKAEDEDGAQGGDNAGPAGSHPGLEGAVAAPGPARSPLPAAVAAAAALVQGQAVGLETHEQLQAPGQAAVDGHGHHQQRGHDDKAQDDEGRGAVVVQDALAVAGGGVQHLWGRARVIKSEKSTKIPTLTSPVVWPGGDSSGQRTLEFPVCSWKKTPLPSLRAEQPSGAICD